MKFYRGINNLSVHILFVLKEDWEKKGKKNLRGLKMTTKWNVQELLEKAEEFMIKSEWTLVEKFIQRIFKMEPENIQALQLQASLNIELGNVDLAREILNKCIKTHPNNYLNYLSLGQIESGLDAKNLYQKSYELSSDSKVKAEICCAIAELYMTDLCDEDDAETICQDKIMEASKLEPDNLNVLKVQADLFLCQQQIEKTKAILNRAFNVIMPQSESYNNDKNNSKAPEQDAMIYEIKLSFATLMIEVGMFEEAMNVLDMLLHENDQIIETWYLLGIACIEHSSSLSSHPHSNSPIVSIQTNSSDDDNDTKDSINDPKEQKLELIDDAIEAFTFGLELALKTHDTEYEQEIINQLQKLNVNTNELVHKIKKENNLIK